MELLNDSDDEEWEQLTGAASLAMSNCSAMMRQYMAGGALEEEEKEDHRALPRSVRKDYMHAQAKACINRDYLGPDALFGADFPLQFAISRPRFQKLMEDIAATGNPFYLSTTSASGKVGASFEARLLLPLKTLSYGVATHCFIDYFQFSKQFALDACRQFDRAVASVYTKDFLRVPTVQDLKDLYTLHKHVHQVDGMIGSLDCSHTFWKNCPTGWQGSYQGKEGKPSIVLEAMCDYHLFFWHVSYGYAGTLNDKTILRMSPLLESMIDGTFEELETEAELVPFRIEGTEEPFKSCFILVDGIYPKYSRFVKGIKEPLSEEESKYTAWQEACRKDIERAFGVLKGKFQFMDRPIHLHRLEDIAMRVSCCLILHNILVSDRVMGSVHERYSPAHSLEELDIEVGQPADLQAVQAGNAGNGTVVGGGIGLTNAPPSVQRLFAKRDRFRALADRGEHARLHQALLNLFGNN